MQTEDSESATRTPAIEERPGYVDPEYLSMAAAVLEGFKHLSYERLQVAPGHRILNLGCGPASDTLTLGAMTGPAGAVVGVDHDPAMVTEANARARDAGVDGWVHHLQADATALPFESASFDRVHSERVLQHLADPEAAFGEMMRVLRRGGLLWVGDPDWGTLSFDSSEVDLERRFVRFRAEKYSHNGFSGRHLYAMFRAHGCEDIVLDPWPLVLTDYTLCRYALTSERLERLAIEQGALTAGELARLRADWEQADARGEFFTSLLIVGVTGRKA